MLFKFKCWIATFVLKRVIVVHGMKRSGNHAIINWIMAQGDFLFFNNIIPIGPILNGQKSIPKELHFKKWLISKLKSRQNLTWSNIIKYRRYTLILSLEDHEIQTNPFGDLPEQTRHIVILRKPVNLFSSRIRKSMENLDSDKVSNIAYSSSYDDAMRFVIKKWKSHAAEFINRTHVLNNKLCINYDNWVDSLAYRQQISVELNLTFSDSGASSISDYGYGSSFETDAQIDIYEHRKSVLNRSQYLSRDELLILDEILEDEELVELSHLIFN